MSFVATFDSEQQIQRLILLTHRDLCRVKGSIVLAEDKLMSNEKLPGNVRSQAEKTVQTAPKQAAVLEGALSALRGALREARKQGTGGG